MYEIVCFHLVFSFYDDLVGMVKIMQKHAKLEQKVEKSRKPYCQEHIDRFGKLGGNVSTGSNISTGLVSLEETYQQVQTYRQVW